MSWEASLQSWERVASLQSWERVASLQSWERGRPRPLRWLVFRCRKKLGTTLGVAVSGALPLLFHWTAFFEAGVSSFIIRLVNQQNPTHCRV